jgi:phage terminase small subunit
VPGKLTPKQECFCQEYLIDLNATQAAIRAGYSAKTAGVIGYEYLKKPQIQKCIQSLRDKRAEKLEITADQVLREYAKLAFSTLGDFMRVQKDGTAYFDLSAMTPDQAAAIQEYSVDEYTEGKAGAKGNGKGEKGRAVKRMRIKLADKKGALDSIGKHIGMFVDRHEVTGATGEKLFDFSSFPSGELESLVSRALSARSQRRT